MDEPIGVETNTFAGLGLSIPLPIQKKNEGGIEQAEVNEEAARLEAKQSDSKSSQNTHLPPSIS